MGIQIPPDAPYSVQKALRELDEKIDYLVSTVARGVSPSDLSQVYNALSQRIEETYRKPTTLDFNDVFRGGGAHALGYVPDPGATTPDGEHVLTSTGFWGPVLEGLVRAVPAGLGGSSRDQRVVNVLASLAVLNALSAETVRARTLNVFGNTDIKGTLTVAGIASPYVLKSGDTMTGALYSPPVCARYFSTSALSSSLVVWEGQSLDNSGGKIVRQSSNTQIKVTEAGFYRVSSQALVTVDVSSEVEYALRHYDSGGNLIDSIWDHYATMAAHTALRTVNGSRIFECSSGDYFTALVSQNAGTVTLYTGSGAIWNDFSIERLN